MTCASRSLNLTAVNLEFQQIRPPKHVSKFEKNNGSRKSHGSKPSCSSLNIGDSEDRYNRLMGRVPAEGRLGLDGVELYKVYRGFVTRVMDKCCR